MGTGYTWYTFHQIYKGDNFCDFLFHFLYIRSLVKRAPHSGAIYIRLLFYKGTPSIQLDKGVKYKAFYKCTLFMLPFNQLWREDGWSEKNS